MLLLRFDNHYYINNYKNNLDINKIIVSIVKRGWIRHTVPGRLDTRSLNIVDRTHVLQSQKGIDDTRLNLNS
jgi:hypothetical protein